MTKVSATQVQKGVVRITPAAKTTTAAPSYEPNFATAPAAKDATTHPITGTGTAEAVVQHATTSDSSLASALSAAETALANVQAAEAKATS